MSNDGSTTITWPDQERRYRLGIGELIELQDKCDAGPAQIFNAICNHTWRVQWVRETIRLGLIGGGLDPVRALGLTAKYVTPGSLFTCAIMAQQILIAALSGDPNDQVGKEPAGEATESRDASPSRPSTEPEPSSASHPAKSGNAHSGNSTPQ